MNRRILLFEGYDGSGKTTLIENLVDYLKKKGIPPLVVGRDYNKIITNITFAIKDKDTDLAPDAEILLRFGRELERIKVVDEGRDEHAFLILDRSIVSAISWIFYYERPFEIFETVASYIINKIGECEVVYCYAPFEVAWARTTARGNNSKKENRGELVNRNMYNALLKTYKSLDFQSIKKVEINMDQEPAACMVDLLRYLAIDQDY